MQKLVLAISAVSLLVLSSCHYGQDEAKTTLDRNEQYKSEKSDYSVNRAGGDATKEEVAATPADTTTK
jgi:hypothetical protein